MFSTIANMVKRYPMASFFGLAYLLSWWAWLQYPDGIWFTAIFSPGPFLAAIIVLALTTGKSGIKDLLKRMIQWRVGLRWYAVALGLPTVLTLLATGLNIFWLGAPGPTTEQLSDWIWIIPTIIALMVVPGIGGVWEEPGWRGYAQDRLQRTHSPLIATIIVALFGVVWHLPLFLIGDIQWPDIILMPAFYIALTWIYNNTRASILMVMLTHATNNAVSGNFFSPMFQGVDADHQALMLALVWSLTALVIVVSGKLQQSNPTVNSFEPPLARIA